MVCNLAIEIKHYFIGLLISFGLSAMETVFSFCFGREPSLIKCRTSFAAFIKVHLHFLMVKLVSHSIVAKNIPGES